MHEPAIPRVNDELHRKILALEAENLQLAGRIKTLEKTADRARDAFSRLAHQVGGLIDHTGTTDLQVINLAEKIFPGYIGTQKQIMDIYNPPKKKGDDKTPKE